jgi:predicted O-methyltransferase YrrM
VGRLVHHPRIGIETLVERLKGKFDSLLRPPPLNRTYSTSMEELVCDLIRVRSTTFRDLVLEVRLARLDEEIAEAFRAAYPDSGDSSRLIRRDWRLVLEGLYVIARVVKPNTVVETGVGAIGASTAYLSEALMRNGRGHLYSIDPNRFRQVFGVDVGAGIPPRLLDWHTLIEGKSAYGLTEVASTTGTIGMFLHDGLHTYNNMLREYRAAWSRLEPGGVVCSDDVVNRAIDRFARETQTQLHACRYGGSAFGAVRRTS